MDNDLKYPIKYAVLELKEKDNHKDIPYGFIVSKCYVVENIIRYSYNGNTSPLYKVVFPFKNISDYIENINRYQRATNIGVHTIPKYDLNGNYYQTDTVDELFDTYEEASILASAKNEKNKAELIMRIPWLDPDYSLEYKKLESSYLEKMTNCKMYEELIAIRTEEMKITKDDIVLIKKKKK